MLPTQQDLLDVAKTHDATIFAQQVNVVEAIKKAQQVDVTVGVATKDLNLTIDLDQHDPFGGNLNNRRVAARIAQMSSRSTPRGDTSTHTGDPEKAARDVEQSLKVLPDPKIPSGDELPPINLTPAKTPTPGSPAASKGKKTAQPAATDDQANDKGMPPAWKPNA